MTFKTAGPRRLIHPGRGAGAHRAALDECRRKRLTINVIEATCTGTFGIGTGREGIDHVRITSHATRNGSFGL